MGALLDNIITDILCLDSVNVLFLLYLGGLWCLL
jgi:hypothetical protein